MNKSQNQSLGLRSGSPVIDAKIIIHPSSSKTMNANTTDKKTERSYKGWIILVLILLLGGLTWYTFGRDDNRDGRNDVPQQKFATDGKSDDDSKVEAESKDSGKTAAAPPADVDFQKQLLDLQKQVSETQKKLAETEGAVRDRDKELAVRSEELRKQQESFETRVATAKTEAKTEFETAQTQKETDRRTALQKSREVVEQDLDKDNFGEVQMDKGWKNGYWVPLVTNQSGNPAPFNGNLTAPKKLVRRGAVWKPVDYEMENGKEVKAWAIVLGKDGQP